ncbi:McrB family protein [Myroides pelagicus]|uniref:AAA domain-containing protein n=1 Tax=Myroides pelagicus TaxID=270914 RepID=A0A7K1GPJ2_9FLAO|nr:hypothetical protein [Myroides pelagicus]MTH30822.1 hypothetical protein [Myroides pelagicus]
MSYFSIRTNDQDTIKKLLEEEVLLSIPGLTWHKDEIKKDDIIFIIVSGDNNKKKIPYDNGLRAIAKVIKLPYDVDKKVYSIDIEVEDLFDESITKDDFYPYPALKNVGSIGPETKQAPNQAIRKLSEQEGIEVLAAINDIGFEHSFIGKIPSGFNLEKLINYDSIELEPEKGLIHEFVVWFNKPENFLISYEGLVNYEYLNFVDNLFFRGELFDIDLDEDIKEQIENKLALIKDKANSDWNSFNRSTSKGAPSAVLGPKNYIKFLKEKYSIDSIKLNKVTVKSPKFDFNTYYNDLEKSNLKFDKDLVKRFVASLMAKPFVILTGLAGSGKTKIAQSFIQWISEEEKQYKIIPVGADWINREPLLGYPDGLQNNQYVTPDSGILELIIEACKEENQDKPYFIVLDEMNLSHVERYFADFLSVMESSDSIKLYTGVDRKSSSKLDIPSTINWPKNLFIIGTVNIDETTYMFSPKVLDRANVIEFRLSKDDLVNFLDDVKEVDLETLVSHGVTMGESFIDLSNDKEVLVDKDLNNVLIEFFEELKNIGAEFGYRSALEINLLFKFLYQVDSSLTTDQRIDFAIMQKLLPKLHGSRSKIVKPLETLMGLCLDDSITDFKFDKIALISNENIKYPVTFEKLKRMYYNAINNGFTSYAEA